MKETHDLLKPIIQLNRFFVIDSKDYAFDKMLNNH